MTQSFVDGILRSVSGAGTLAHCAVRAPAVHFFPRQRLVRSCATKHFKVHFRSVFLQGKGVFDMREGAPTYNRCIPARDQRPAHAVLSAHFAPAKILALPRAFFQRCGFVVCLAGMRFAAFRFFLGTPLISGSSEVPGENIHNLRAFTICPFRADNP